MGEIVHDYDDLKPISELVKYGGNKYYLREATAGAAVEYRNARTNSYRFESGRIVGYRDLASIELLLVSRCLFTEKGQPVDEDTVKTWKPEVVTSLYQRAKEISKLSEDQPEREALLAALAMGGSPISLADLRRYVLSVKPNLDKVGVDRLLTFLSEPESDVKNSSSATAATSA